MNVCISSNVPISLCELLCHCSIHLTRDSSPQLFRTPGNLSVPIRASLKFRILFRTASKPLTTGSVSTLIRARNHFVVVLNQGLKSVIHLDSLEGQPPMNVSAPIRNPISLCELLCHWFYINPQIPNSSNQSQESSQAELNHHYTARASNP